VKPVECPAENTWLRYVGGDGDVALDAHLDGCADCRIIYAELARGEAVFERGALIGRYVVLDVIGKGGMGIVYKAFDPELDRAIALKLVTINEEPEAARQRLVREAKTLARLSHPNVVVVHDVGTIGDDVFVAMEYVAGVTLRQWLRAKPRSPREIIDVLAAAARGLAAAHRLSIVHRDFKPENVMVEDDGRVRVLDFGLARSAGVADASRAPTDRDALARVTRSGAIAGTPPYMAPEQERGLAVDAKSDQYSLCVVLYEALYGERPARDVRPPVRRGVSARVRRALATGLRANPEARHASIDALIDALRDRKRVQVAVAAVAIAALVAGGAALWITRAPSVDDACTVAADDAVRVWDPARRTAMVARAGEPIAVRIDDWTRAWSARRKELCVQMMQSDRDRSQDIGHQVSCLRRRLTDLDASLSVILESKLDPTVVLASMRAPTVCDSFERGTVDDATRARWMPMVERMITARVALAEGRVDDAEAAARAAVADARQQPEPEALGATLSVLGLVHAERGQFAEGYPMLLEAIRLSTVAREDTIVVESWSAILLMAMRGHDKDVDSAIFGAEVAALKLPEDDPLRCMVAARTGMIHLRRAEPDVAQPKLERALACWSKISTVTYADAIAESSFAVGLLRSKRGDWDAAKRDLTAAVTRWEQGKPHADFVMALDALGTIALVQEDDAAAERAFRRALELAQALDDASIGETAGHLAYVLVRQQKCSDAVPLLALAKARHVKAHGERSVQVAGVMLGEAMCALAAGDAARAKQLVEAAKPIADAAPSANTSQVALTDFTLARAIVATQGSRPRAIALAEAALARLEGHPFATHRREITDWLAKHR
jgi:serine/threonine protein kinase/tetratricopeptide (TPR) repeat protein